MFLAACVQLRCTTDIERNLDAAEQLIRRAASHGAVLVATPENTPFLGPQLHKVDLAEPLDGAIATRFRRLAAELRIHLLLGSFSEQRRRSDGSVDGQRCYNTSLLYGPDGVLVASYRKIHLFDVDVPGGPRLIESECVAPGSQVVVAETSLGKIGMSICYDLRFPELYRQLVDSGAELIAIPAAFTLTTGKDHWHTLVRARAIETQTWVLAPAQWGAHDSMRQRESYGHSLIVDPWGAAIADAGHGEGLCFAEIDLSRNAEIRRAVPVQQHRRL